jgi:NADP-dependent 3-hydroxy acid dehydrogenase YdfG
MTQNLLLVGAGTGFALASAQRFGADGYAVHLVARSPARLGQLADRLATEGVTAHVYPGDATDHAGLTKLITEIDTAHPIDACIFQPGLSDSSIVDVLAASVDNVRPNLDLLVLGAVAVGEALVPAMVGRGAGSLIFVGGGSARQPLREFGNLGMAMAGLRAYALTLNAALAGTGVHSAFYTVAGMIATGTVEPGLLDPVQLADRMRRLVEARDVREVIMTAGGEVVPRAAR